jgi:hypothetical protein
MSLLFIDYTNLVIKAYEEKRESNRLSRLLMHPTTANIRQECLNVYNERIKKGEVEEDILRAFFGVPPAGKSFDYIIERYPADKFRPLRSLIKRKIRNPSLVNVELLAWLIDFNPRPLAYAQTILGVVNEPTHSVIPTIDNGGNKPGSELLQTNVNGVEQTTSSRGLNILQVEGAKIPIAESKDDSMLFIDNSKGNSQIFKLKIAVAIGLIVTILFGGMYTWEHEKLGEMFFGNVNTGCMYWTGDHYEKIPCNEELKGRIILPLDEEKRKNFRRITRIDTITKWSIGKVYYIKDSNVLKYYTGSGSYPEDLNRNLKVLSMYIFSKYLNKKETPVKDSLGEQIVSLSNR